MTSTESAGGSRKLRPFVCLAVPLAVLMWAYGATFVELARLWAENPSFSHGFLVLLFAIFLLWFRRGMVEATELRPSLLGLPVLASSVGMRLGGTYFSLAWLDPLSLIPAVAGIFLLVGGWRGLRWAWPTSLFLFFLVPLPLGLLSWFMMPLALLLLWFEDRIMTALFIPPASPHWEVKEEVIPQRLASPPRPLEVTSESQRSRVLTGV